MQKVKKALKAIGEVLMELFKIAKVAKQIMDLFL